MRSPRVESEAIERSRRLGRVFYLLVNSHTVFNCRDFQVRREERAALGLTRETMHPALAFSSRRFCVHAFASLSRPLHVSSSHLPPLAAVVLQISRCRP